MIRAVRLEIAAGDGRNPDDERGGNGRHTPAPPSIAACMVFIKKVTDGGTANQHEGENQPIIVRGKGERVVAANHREQDWQGQIIIVYRALFSLFAVFGIGRFAGTQRFDDLALARDDDVGHIRHHDGADDGAAMDEGTAGAKHLAQQKDDQRKGDQAERCQDALILTQFGAAGDLVKDECAKQAGDAYGNRHAT